MAPSLTEKQTDNNPLLPPDERFWQRYSANHEFPLSGVGSLVAHGLVVGVLILIGYRLSMTLEMDSRPPGVDVVGIEGGGDIFAGFGGSPGLPGPDTKGQRTELVPGQPETKAETAPKSPAQKLLDPTQVETLTIPPPVGAAEKSVDLDAFLDDVQRQAAEESFHKAMKVASAAPAGGTDKIGQGGKPGTKGTGTGGIKGDGTGSIKGKRAATPKEILAFRWRFDLAGTGKEHADKLDKAGVVVAVLNPSGTYLVIRDLKRRPVEPKAENLAQFQNAVKWYNSDPASIFHLTKELQLSFVPTQVVMLLPKDREEKMAAEEERLALERGINPKLIQRTWFDFQLRNGAFEPVAIRIE